MQKPGIHSEDLSVPAFPERFGTIFGVGVLASQSRPAKDSPFLYVCVYPTGGLLTPSLEHLS